MSLLDVYEDDYTNMHSNIRSIALTETFHEEDNVKLSEEELKEVHRIRDDLTLQRRDPAAYDAMMVKRAQAYYAQSTAERHEPANTLSAGQVGPADAASRRSSNATPNRVKSNEDGLVARQAGTYQNIANVDPRTFNHLQASGTEPVNGPAPVVLSQGQQALSASSSGANQARAPLPKPQPVQKLCPPPNMQVNSISTERKQEAAPAVNSPAKRPLPNPQPVQKLGPRSNVQVNSSSLKGKQATPPVNSQAGGQIPVSKLNSKASSRDSTKREVPYAKDKVPAPVKANPSNSIKGAAPTANGTMAAEKARSVGLVTPKRTRTPTSGQVGKPVTPSKSNFRIAIPITPGTPSKSTGTPSKSISTPSKTASIGPDAHHRSATAPAPAVGSRGEASSTIAGVPRAPVLKRKLSDTSMSDKYSRATDGRFVSTYKSLDNAFKSGTLPWRKRAKQ